MATIKGIELVSDIYDLEDTQGRTATQTAQNTANNASNKADSNETAIEAIQAVIPSTATGSNKLVAEDELSGLCRIVTTNHTVQAGFEINIKYSEYPNCSWSNNIAPTPPSEDAVLIGILSTVPSWFPNLTPFVRDGNIFNLVSFEDYILTSNATYKCVWAVPNS